MIYSEKQYSRTKHQLQDLMAARAQIAENNATRDWLKKAELSALDFQIIKIKKEIEHFEKLKGV